MLQPLELTPRILPSNLFSFRVSSLAWRQAPEGGLAVGPKFIGAAGMTSSAVAELTAEARVFDVQTLSNPGGQVRCAELAVSLVQPHTRSPTLSRLRCGGPCPR